MCIFYTTSLFRVCWIPNKAFLDLRRFGIWQGIVVLRRTDCPHCPLPPAWAQWSTSPSSLHHLAVLQCVPENRICFLSPPLATCKTFYRRLATEHDSPMQFNSAMVNIKATSNPRVASTCAVGACSDSSQEGPLSPLRVPFNKEVSQPLWSTSWKLFKGKEPDSKHQRSQKHMNVANGCQYMIES